MCNFIRFVGIEIALLLTGTSGTTVAFPSRCAINQSRERNNMLMNGNALHGRNVYVFYVQNKSNA